MAGLPAGCTITLRRVNLSGIMGVPSTGAAVAGVHAGRKLRPRRLVSRALACAGLVVVAYGLLPWWLPRGWVAKRVEETLGGLAAGDVEVGRIEVGWREGIVVRDVRVSSAVRRGWELRLRRLAVPLQPVRIWWNGQIPRLEVSGAQCIIDIGRLKPLPPAQRDRDVLPAWHVLVHDGDVRIISDIEGEAPLNLSFRWIELRADPRTGRLTHVFTAAISPADKAAGSEQQAGVPSGGVRGPVAAVSAKHGALEGETELVLPRMKRTAPLAGRTTLRWHSLDLGAIPRGLWHAVRLPPLAGQCAGTLSLRLDERAGVAFDVTADVRALRVEADSKPRMVGEASLALSGDWDPAVHQVQVERLRFDVPGVVSVWGPAEGANHPALHSEPAGSVRFGASLVAEVHDLEAAVRRWLEGLPWWPAGLRAEGSGRVVVSLEYGVRGASVRVDIQGSELAVWHAGRLYHERGAPASATVAVAWDRAAQRLTWNEGRIRWGATTATVEGYVDLGRLRSGGDGADWFDVLLATEATVSAETADAAEWLSLWAAAEEGAGKWEAAGPAALRLGLTGDRSRAIVAIEADLPRGTVFAAGQWWSKSQDEDARAALRWEIGEEAGRVTVKVGGDLRSGPARVVIDPERTTGWLAIAGRPSAAAQHQAVAADIHARLHAEISQVGHFASQSPWLADALRAGHRKQVVEGAGQVAMGLDGLWLGGWQALRLEGRAEFTKAAVALGRWYRKPAGRPLSLWWEYSFDAEARDSHALYGVIESEAGSVELAAAGRGEGVQSEEGRLVLGDVAHFLSYFDADVVIQNASILQNSLPALSEALGGVRLAGGLSAGVRLARDGGGWAGTYTFDATDLGVKQARDGAQRYLKWGGVEAISRGRVAIAVSPDSGAVLFSVGDATASFGDSRVVRAAVAGRWEPGLRRFVVDRIEGTASVDTDEPLRLLVPGLREADLPYRIAGRVGLRARAERAEGDLYRFVVEADGREALVAWQPWVVKVPGQEAAARITGAVGRPSDWDSLWRLGVQSLAVRTEDAEVRCEGDLSLALASTGSPVADVDGRLDVTAVVEDLRSVATVILPLAEVAPSGRVAGSAKVAFDDGTAEIGDWTFEANDVRFDVRGEPVVVSARAGGGDGSARVERLEARLAGTSLVLSGVLDGASAPPAAEVFVLAPRLDVDRLVAVWPKVVEAGRQSGLLDLIRRAGRGSDAARGAGRFRCRRLFVTDPGSGVRFAVDELACTVEYGDGVVSVSGRCALNGGLVTGSATAYLDAEPPYYEMGYRAEALLPAPGPGGTDLRPYLAASFPGLEAEGAVTLIDASRQRLDRPQAADNYPVGRGELIVEGGVVAGRAAPEYMTRVFPGLELARFRFDRMHDWFVKHADGRIEHNMIFRGKVYHLYAVGVTDLARHEIDYEVGIDVLASYEKQQWVEVGHGRIPLFTKRGLVGPGGTLLNERVQYVPPWRVLESVFWKNNVVKTAYLALTERIRRLREAEHR